MYKLLIGVFFALSLYAQTSITTGVGAPPSTTCNKTIQVGRMYGNSSTNPVTVYVCGTTGWGLAGGGSGGGSAAGPVNTVQKSDGAGGFIAAAILDGSSQVQIATKGLALGSVSNNATLQIIGTTSGSFSLGCANVCGSSNQINLPTADGAANSVLVDAGPIAGAQQTSWQASSGTGNIVRTTSPTLITPVLGVATATSVSVGSGPSVTPGTAGVFAGGEGTVPSVCATTSVDCLYWDSTQHGPLLSRNNGSYLPLPQGPATTTSGDIATWNSTNGGLMSDTPTLGVAHGGTGLQSGTSGGVPCYTGTTTITSSSALTANSLMVGGGAGVCPTVLTPSFSTLTDAATVTWAIGSAIIANGGLTFTAHSGSRALNLTGLVNGGSYVVWLKQDSTGGEGLTLGTGCTWKVSGGGSGAVTLSTAAAAIDVLAFTYDGTNCYANFAKNYN